MHDEYVDPFVNLLGPGFYADPEMIRDAIRHHSNCNVLDLSSGFKVDIFLPQGDAFDQARFRRRVAQPLLASGEEVYVASLEDTLLAKLDWYRQGGEASERQWNDILGLLKVQAGSIDAAYLHTWARTLGLDARCSVPAPPA